MIQIEEDDDDFLSQVAEAEAHALSNSQPNKRRRVINSLDVVQKEEEKVVEGYYIAALRGSKSLLWQQQQRSLLNNATRAKPLAPSKGSNGSGAVIDSRRSSELLVPEKSCPCGLGACVVFTANTQRNLNRKFYKCPVRQENGGCGFFEWCDGGSAWNSSNSMFPDLPCPCGDGSCLVLTAKTGKNIGRQFYRCPANQGSSCGFFKWCNDNVVVASPPASASKVYNSMNDSSDKSNGIRTGSSCFKCGMEGHWAKNCSTSSGSHSHSPVELGERAASANTCYKCSKPGHWARNCTASQYMKK